MGYEQVSVVDEIMNIVNGITSWAIKIISIVVNVAIEISNMVIGMF